jgi:hypothetical protein
MTGETEVGKSRSSLLEEARSLCWEPEPAWLRHQDTGSRHGFSVAQTRADAMGRGPLIQIEAAKEQAREMREGYPDMYE